MTCREPRNGGDEQNKNISVVCYHSQVDERHAFLGAGHALLDDNVPYCVHLDYNCEADSRSLLCLLWDTSQRYRCAYCSDKYVTSTSNGCFSTGATVIIRAARRSQKHVSEIRPDGAPLIRVPLKCGFEACRQRAAPWRGLRIRGLPYRLPVPQIVECIRGDVTPAAHEPVKVVACRHRSVHGMPVGLGQKTLFPSPQQSFFELEPHHALITGP